LQHLVLLNDLAFKQSTRNRCEALYTAVMLLKNSGSKLVGTSVAVLLFGGLSIAWFQIGSNGSKRRTTRSAERNRMTKPLIQGRVATEADYHCGVAVFSFPDGHSAPFSLGRDLPIRAELVKSDGMDWPVGSQISVVQAEITDGRHRASR